MYLRQRDYDRLIQSDNLNQILSSDDNIRLLAEQDAKEEVESYLISKYDIASELSDLVAFSMLDTYYPGQRVMLSGYAAYVPTATYLTASKTIVQVGTGTTATAWLITQDLANAGVWQDSFGIKLGNMHDIWTLSFVADMFNLYKEVKAGALKYWKGLLYKALKPWMPATHYDQLQAKTYPNNLYPNVMPNQDVSGQFWYGGATTGIVGYFPGIELNYYDINTAYGIGDFVFQSGIDYVAAKSSTGVTPGTDVETWIPIKFLKGDSRSQKLVSIMIDVVLYHIHSRIAPRNIPDLRVKRYDDAIQWLKDANSGNITPNLPLLQPYKGRVRWGGNTKSNNIY